MKEKASKKISYPEAMYTHLYNAHPTLKEIKITHDPSHPDARYRVIDNSNLGIEPGSLADFFVINTGDPQLKSDIVYDEANAIELEVLSICGKLLNIKEPYGYVTTGGTEGNHACIWWN